MNGRAAAIDGFDVEAFAVPHDSSGGCFGYLVHHETLIGRSTVALATDLGYPPEGLARRFADAHAVVIESNHDLQMLESSRRPDWLKQRIREIGHLSNEQSGLFVSEILGHAGTPPQAIVLAHLAGNATPPRWRWHPCKRHSIPRASRKPTCMQVPAANRARWSPSNQNCHD